MCCTALSESLRRLANSGTTCTLSTPRVKRCFMFAPRAVQQHTRERTPAYARQTAEDLTHGLTHTKNARDSVQFLQRYLGNSSLQSHVIGRATPQASAVPSVVYDVVRSSGQPL